MHSILQDLETRPPADALPKLKELARLGLCEARHEYQVEETIGRFREKKIAAVIKDFEITELRLQLDTERRERRRLERFFGEEDEGYGDDETEGVEAGSYSIGESSDRTLMQAFEEAEIRAQAEQHQYSVGNSSERALMQALEDAEMAHVHEGRDSVPGSDEEFELSINDSPQHWSPAPPSESVEDDRIKALDDTIFGLQSNFHDATRRLARGPTNIPRRSIDRPLAETSLGRSLSKELSIAEARRTELGGQCDLFQDQITDEQTKSGILERNVDTVKSDHAELLDRVDIIHDVLADGVEQTEKLSSEVEEIRRIQSDISTEIEGLRLEVTAGRERQDDLEIERTEAEAEINGSIASCRIEIEHLRRKLERNENLGADQLEIIHRLSTRVTSLEEGQTSLQALVEVAQNS